LKAARYLVKGVVQGVGFRPTVRRVAVSLGLSGTVRNTPEGVVIEVEGDSEAVEAFGGELLRRAPPLSRIDSVEAAAAPVRGLAGFTILRSEEGDAASALVPPDVATCDACLAELFDAADRRYRYPFINCTDCGPRFSIIEGMPYDRPRTTMSGFAMCADCAAEYADPADRRYHAQPVACPVCGPQVRLIEGDVQLEGEQALERAVVLLDSGAIVAVKGLGGFHLACDATREAAVSAVRLRKGRPEGKPLALMVAGPDEARRLCHIDGHEEAMLLSPERPIVLLRRRGADDVAPSVAPRMVNYGLMLPYTPLHHLLMAGVAARALVMTSGNISEEPLVRDLPEARERLGGVADAYLDNDRPIARRCDDSVACSFDGAPMLLRRSRGYAPLPVRMPLTGAPVLAFGGDLKAAFCLTRGEEAFVSQHIGDLEALRTYEAFGDAVDDLCRLLCVEPRLVACDLHPRYLSRRFALEYAKARGLPVCEVQHHHAHAASVLADAGRSEAVVAMCMDGTGYGVDGTVWGAEWLLADFASSRRLARMHHARIPGGDAAVVEPWRMGVSWLLEAYNGRMDRAEAVMPASMAAMNVSAIAEMVVKGVAAPQASSCGRLFDAGASILGLRQSCAFEAQAAMELEAAAGEPSGAVYPCEVYDDGELLVFDPRPLVRALAEDAASGADVSACAGRFHDALAAGMSALCVRLCRREGVDLVALSGGCFQNRRLLRGVRDHLKGEGITVLLHRLVPPNDGGVSLGQAAVALGRAERG